MGKFLLACLVVGICFLFMPPVPALVASALILLRIYIGDLATLARRIDDEL